MAKKSAADIEALRWREMFQAALTGLNANTANPLKYAETVAAAASQADLALREFHARYERESR